MFCKFCGSPCETGVCPSCAAARGQAQPQPQQPQQPQYQQPQYQQPQYQQPQYQPRVRPAGAGVKPYWHLSLAGVALLAFVWGILNLFSVFHVNGVSTAGSMSQSEYMSVADAAEGLEYFDSGDRKSVV